MVAAILAAGGVGRRMGVRTHKPFVPLAGQPMLCWALAALQSSRAVREIVVVAHRKDLPAVRRLVRRLRFSKVSCVVPGGASRRASVFQGMRALPREAEWVLVHDAARPLVTPALIHRAIRGACDGAAITAVPVVPTIKEARDGWVLRTLDRSRLWAVQTPQVFRRDLLERAHRRGRANGTEATDDAALVEKLGWRVRIVAGSHRNIKVTTPEDLVIAEALLRSHANRNRV